MGKEDPRIDKYIAKSPEFARPILSTLRTWIHKACPDVTETMKWSFPHFEYHGVFAGMASFKAHATFGFWKGEIIFAKSAVERNAMGQFGRMASVKDLPSEARFARWVKQAMKLNEEGVKVPSRAKPKTAKQPLVIPPYFKAALRRSEKAQATFEAFSYSHKKEYVAWITEAKTDETRERRLETAIEWMEAGKPRMWKYLKK